MTKYNNKLNELELLKTETAKKISNGILEVIEVTSNKIEELKSSYGVNDRKALKAIKQETLNLNDGVKPCKHLNRGYSIGLAYVKRGFVIEDIASLTNCLTIAQIENLINHATVADIKSVISSSEDIRADIAKDILKSLKTREVVTKTFEKKSK